MTSNHHRHTTAISIALAAAFGLAVAPVAAQDDADADGARAAIEAAAIEAFDILGSTQPDLSTLPVTVPFEYILDHIVIEASIAGSEGTFPVVVDTGAPSNFTDSLIEAAGPTREAALISKAIDGTESIQPIVAVPSLGIGDAAYSDVGMMRGFLGSDNPLNCVSRYGLIGANIMKDTVWQFDYPNRQITIAPTVDGLDHIDGAIAAEWGVARPDNPSPYLPVRIGEGQHFFVVDTGSSGSVSLNPADLTAVGVEVATDGPTQNSISAGTSGMFESSLTYQALDLGIGDGEFAGYPVATNGTLEAGLGNIGNGFFEDFVVTIDWPNFMLYLDPVGEPLPPTPGQAAVSWAGDGIIVNRLIAGSELESAGLPLGAEVVSVDGQDVTSITLDEACPIVAGDLPETFDIELADGSTFTIGPADDFFSTLE